MVVLAALLPTAALSVVAVVVLQRQQRAEVTRASIETMRAMGSAVDQVLDNTRALAETLAVSQALDNGDLPAFYEEAQRVASLHPDWVTIALSDTAGQQVINVLEPLDATLPSVADRESFRRVISTGKSAVGNLNPAPGEPGVAVRVPVMRDGKITYVLTVVVSPESMREVIRRQKVAPDAVLSIYDAQGNHVARSRNHERYLGKPGSKRLREIMASGNEGWGASITLEGQPTYAAFSRSAVSGWSVAVGIPKGEIDAVLRQALITMGVGAVLSLLLGVLASLMMARLITGPIAALRLSAQTVGRGEVPQLPPMQIAEIQEVAQALVGAARARQQAERSREELLEREREARTAAEDANRSKDEFLAMLGHELRNPLSAISNAVSVIEASRQMSPDAAQRAQAVIRRQVDHLARMVDDLLDVARLVTGKVLLKQEELELAENVKHSIATLKAGGVLDAHELSLETEPVWIRGDSTRLEQVVNNLVVNAVKYTPKDGHIWVTVKPRGDRAILEVRDDGVGIDGELLSQVFELFTQGERALDRSQGGLGIGLTLVRQLVEQHGGSVRAESAGLGSGSKFIVELPSTEAGELDSPDTPSTLRQGCRVLIVEDNSDARDMLRALLEMFGHSVRVAADGPAGVKLALDDKPRVALIDLGLPGFDGYEVARRIRAELTRDDTFLVALSGYGSAADKQRSRQAGFDLHLVKPVGSEDLNQMLQAVMQPAPAPARGASSG
ncbi:MAG TPA: ATP-binding protein [Aggregatilineales bacterium]|nr:ATP-binding protein [Aggregatilineales bacterium]